MDPFVHRVVRIEPLRILLVAVEHEGLPDEAFADELVHVADRGRVPEGQADLRLEILRPRQLVRAPHVPVVVAHRLLDQDVFAGLERGEGQLLVTFAPTARDHVDHVDVATAEHLRGIVDRLGDVELLRGRVREVLVEVADHDDLAQRRTREARQVRAVRPAARPDDADAQLLLDQSIASSGRSTQRR